MKKEKKLVFTDLQFESHPYHGSPQAILNDRYSILAGGSSGIYADEGEYEVGDRKSGEWVVEGHCSKSRVVEIINGAAINELEKSIEEDDESAEAAHIKAEAIGNDRKIYKRPYPFMFLD